MGFDVEKEAEEIAVENEGQVIEIVAASGKVALDDNGKPVTWTVCGINSAQYRKAEAWQRKKYRTFRGRDLTDAEHIAVQAEFVARCSLGCSGFKMGGQVLPFTTENATTILVKLPHVRRQVEAAMGDHEGFTKKGSES